MQMYRFNRKTGTVEPVPESTPDMSHVVVDIDALFERHTCYDRIFRKVLSSITKPAELTGHGQAP